MIVLVSEPILEVHQGQLFYPVPIFKSFTYLLRILSALIQVYLSDFIIFGAHIVTPLLMHQHHHLISLPTLFLIISLPP